MTNTIDKNNKQQQQALDLIQNTNTTFFLTGRAGTGKTTFLKNFLIIWPRQVSRSLFTLIAGRNKKDMQRLLLNALPTHQCTKLDSRRYIDTLGSEE